MSQLTMSGEQPFHDSLQFDLTNRLIILALTLLWEVMHNVVEYLKRFHHTSNTEEKSLQNFPEILNSFRFSIFIAKYSKYCDEQQLQS